MGIPDTKPRIAAWNRKLVDDVTKLDTNPDGSFGMLRLKESSHSVSQSSLAQMDDIQKFVSHKVPVQKKRKLCGAISNVFSGVTDLLGTFVREVSQIEDEPEPSLRSSKRNRNVQYDKPEPSLRRSKRNNISVQGDCEESLELDTEEDTKEDSDYVDEGTDGDSEEEPDYSEHPDFEDEDLDDKEDGECDRDKSRDEDDEDVDAKSRDAGTEKVNRNVDMPGRQVEEVLHSQDDETEDFVPLISCLRRADVQQVHSVQRVDGIDKKAGEPSSKASENKDCDFQPAPLEVVPPGRRLGNAAARRV